MMLSRCSPHAIIAQPFRAALPCTRFLYSPSHFSHFFIKRNIHANLSCARADLSQPARLLPILTFNTIKKIPTNGIIPIIHLLQFISTSTQLHSQHFVNMKMLKN